MRKLELKIEEVCEGPQCDKVRSHKHVEYTNWIRLRRMEKELAAELGMEIWRRKLNEVLIRYLQFLGSQASHLLENQSASSLKSPKIFDRFLPGLDSKRQLLKDAAAGANLDLGQIWVVTAEKYKKLASSAAPVVCGFSRLIPLRSFVGDCVWVAVSGLLLPILRGPSTPPIDM